MSDGHSSATRLYCAEGDDTGRRSLEPEAGPSLLPSDALLTPSVRLALRDEERRGEVPLVGVSPPASAGPLGLEALQQQAPKGFFTLDLLKGLVGALKLLHLRGRRCRAALGSHRWRIHPVAEEVTAVAHFLQRQRGYKCAKFFVGFFSLQKEQCQVPLDCWIVLTAASSLSTLCLDLCRKVSSSLTAMRRSSTASEHTPWRTSRVEGAPDKSSVERELVALNFKQVQHGVVRTQVRIATVGEPTNWEAPRLVALEF